jgi:hypothetical protein
LVNGNPVENIRLVEDPAKNLLIIMKDGRIYKNARHEASALFWFHLDVETLKFGK